MVSVVLVGIYLALLLYSIYKWAFYKPKGFPQGPPRFPIFGTYPLLLLLNYKHVYKAVDWLRRLYRTDILGLYAIDIPTVVANTTESVRALLENRAFDGRAVFTLVRIRDPAMVPRGIFFTDGPLWHEQRRFALRYLRDFGFGRRQEELEVESQKEILEMIDCIKNGPKFEFEKKYHDGNSVLMPHILMVIYSNLFHKVLLNERLPREKKHFLLEAALHVKFFTETSEVWGRMFSYWDMIPKLFPNFSDYNALRKSAMKYHDCIKTIVDEQHRSYNENEERTFLDLYFKRMDESKGDATSTFSYDQMIMVIADFFLPAFFSNSGQTQFLFQRFYLQPEILKKCQNEIDKVVGRDRLPTLNDRVNLPYVEATIRESLRHETLLPNGLPHATLTDTTIMGYDIPKNTLAFASLYAAHREEKTFHEPLLFRPERFLDENGKFSPKLDKSIPFGAGRRLCAGETFARNSMFLVISALVQQFDFEIPSDSRMPLTDESSTGIVRFLPDYRLKFLPRQ